MSIESIRMKYPGTEWIPNTEVLMMMFCDELLEAKELLRCELAYLSSIEWANRKFKMHMGVNREEFWAKIVKSDTQPSVRRLIDLVKSNRPIEFDLSTIKAQIANLDYRGL